MIDRLTFPRLRALNAAWKRLPPPALALARITMALGIAPAEEAEDRPAAPPAAPPKATPLDQAMRALGRAGMPVIGQRPDDPMLDLAGY